MNEIYASLLSSAGLGIVGSILRFIIDVKKAKVRITSQGLLFYIWLMIITGSFAGIALDYGWIGSVLAGYVSLDLMDGFYKKFSKTNVKIVKKK